MKREWERLAPPGIGAEAEIKWLLTGMALSLLLSLRFLLAYLSAREALFMWVGSDKLLIPGAMMPDFAQLLDGSLVGFGILALCMAPLAAYHYAYHFQGGRSVYLMRRLPQRGEMHRRCLALPALAALACALAAAVLALAYFGLYRGATPQECLPPLQKIFTAWTGALT